MSSPAHPLRLPSQESTKNPLPGPSSSGTLLPSLQSATGTLEPEAPPHVPRKQVWAGASCPAGPGRGQESRKPTEAKLAVQAPAPRAPARPGPDIWAHSPSPAWGQSQGQGQAERSGWSGAAASWAARGAGPRAAGGAAWEPAPSARQGRGTMAGAGSVGGRLGGGQAQGGCAG